MLRAAAVLAVVLYHLPVLFPDLRAARWATPAPLYFGYAGVDLFFVISGFIVMHVTQGEHGGARQFLAKRLLRILPLYWAVSTLILIVWLVMPSLVPFRGVSASIFVLDSYLLIPGRERPMLGVGWTLQHEIQFYGLMAVLLALRIRRFAAPALLAIFAGAVVLRVVVDPDLAFWDGKLLSLYSIQFALGVIAYGVNRSWRVGPAWLLILAGVAGFVATGAIVMPLMPPDREVPVIAAGAFGLVRALGFGMSAFLILLGALNLEPTTASTSRLQRWPAAIGDASYMIYLTHNVVLQALALITHRLPEAALVMIGAVCLALAVVVATGLIGHHYLERPLMWLLERRVLPRLVKRR
jgi:peptidoglycan/LPS O-acetylase OafA/YrhL